jgi:signal transduction protein with GAF and PtsI domain
MSIVRNTLAAVATSALLSLTAACGAGSTAAICTDATKALTDYSSSVAASASNLENLNKANEELAAKFTELAGKADGDLKSSLTKIADAWAGFKIDASDPAAAMSKVSEFSKKATDAAQELQKACS